MRRAATRLSVASIGRPGPSTRTRGEIRATSSATSITSVYSVRPASTTPSRRETSRASPCARITSAAEHLVLLIRRARPLGECLRHPEDHGHGGAELVAESAHELVASGGAFEQCLLGQLELTRSAALPLEGLGELADHPGSHHRRDHAAAGGCLTDRVEDLLAVGVLQHVAGGARDQHLSHGVLVLDTGECHDPHLGEGRFQQPRRLDPVHLRHPDVHQDDVRLGGTHEAHGVGTARCGAHDDELLGPEQRREGLPEPRIVVHDGNPDVGTEGWSDGEGMEGHL